MRETCLILDPSGQAGSITRESLFSRRLAVELQETAAGMPREILFFLVWLALMIHRKDSADSAA
jgi:hypothetical protein